MRGIRTVLLTKTLLVIALSQFNVYKHTKFVACAMCTVTERCNNSYNNNEKNTFELIHDVEWERMASASAAKSNSNGDYWQFSWLLFSPNLIQYKDWSYEWNTKK